MYGIVLMMEKVLGERARDKSVVDKEKMGNLDLLIWVIARVD